MTLQDIPDISTLPRKGERVQYNNIRSEEVAGYCGAIVLRKLAACIHHRLMEPELYFALGTSIWRRLTFPAHIALVLREDVISPFYALTKAGRWHQGADIPDNIQAWTIGDLHIALPSPMQMPVDKQSHLINTLLERGPSGNHPVGFMGISERFIYDGATNVERPFLPTLSRGVQVCMCSAWDRVEVDRSDTWTGNRLGDRLVTDYPELLAQPRDTWVKLKDQDKYMCLPFMMYNKLETRQSVTLVFADEPLPIQMQEYKV